MKNTQVLENAVSNLDFIKIMNTEKFKVRGVYRRNLEGDNFELHVHYTNGDLVTEQQVLSREDYGKMEKIYLEGNIHSYFLFQLGFKELQRRLKRATRRPSVIRKLIGKLEVMM